MAGNAAKKQLAENQRRLQLLAAAIAGVNLLYILLRAFWFWSSWTFGIQFVFFLCNAVILGCAYLLYKAAKPGYGPNKELLYGGADLAGAGLNEYIHDIIYVSLFVLLLSLVTDYAWLFLLVIPGYAIFKLWNGVIAPWIFAPQAEAPEMDEKARKKMERKNHGRIVNK